MEQRGCAVHSIPKAPTPHSMVCCMVYAIRLQGHGMVLERTGCRQDVCGMVSVGRQDAGSRCTCADG